MFRSTTKIGSLLESLPQDSINEIASYLEYKQLTKLRLNKHMNDLIEETPAGKKARSATILRQREDDVQLLKRIMAPTLLGSISYIIAASTIMASLIESKVLTPDNSLSGYMTYLGLDIVMSAFFAASLVRIDCGHHYRDGYATLPAMTLGALTTVGACQGALIAFKSAKLISDIAHLPKNLQYVGALLGLAAGFTTASNIGIYAMKGQHVYTMFHDKKCRYKSVDQVYEIRDALAPKKLQG